MARGHFSYSILDSLYMYIYVLKRKMKRNRKISYSSLKKLNNQIGRRILELWKREIEIKGAGFSEVKRKKIRSILSNAVLQVI